MGFGSLVTLGGEGEFHLIEKKSEFIGYAAPVKNEAEALSFIDKIKSRHKDARHNVSAYVCGSVMHQSDDGEPQGTGGVPVLDVIKKNGIDILALTERARLPFVISYWQACSTSVAIQKNGTDNLLKS